MEDILKKLGPTEVATLLRLLGSSSRSAKLYLPPVDLKLDRPTTNLGWSRRVKKIFTTQKVGGLLTGELKKRENPTAGDEWKSTHMTLFMWLLSSVVPSIAATVGLKMVMEVWDKLRSTYDGVENVEF